MVIEMGIETINLECEIGKDCKGAVSRCQILHDSNYEPENVIILCQRHHRGFDGRMKGLLASPHNDPRETGRSYYRQFRKNKSLIYLRLAKNAYIHVWVAANMRTGNAHISSTLDIVRRGP